MDQHRVARPQLLAELADRLQKRLALNIAHGPADFDNGDPVFLRRPCLIKPGFDLVGDMRDHLDRPSAEISVAFLLEDRPVNLSCGHIGILIQALVDKPFIMAQIQIRLRPVVRNKNLAVLNGIHGSRIDVDIGIKFLHGNLIASSL